MPESLGHRLADGRGGPGARRMAEFNPYEAPSADEPGPPGSARGGGVWREGDVLVMARGAVLPDLCVKCAAPAGGYRLRRNLSWHPWPIYLLIIFCNILI